MPPFRKSRTYGHIPDFPVGAAFKYRRDALAAGVHGVIRKGIHGDRNGGAFSICVSGRYMDNEDFGDKIIYVGSGGQTNRGTQIGGQSFANPENQSLLVSHETQMPVRVLRGPDKHNPHAPRYRYDGLYVVENWYKRKGKAGYDMCFFELTKIEEEGDD
ncbi:SRA-YDG [Imleria badia]|nr:SRA-YDG [Imleria badia]